MKLISRLCVMIVCILCTANSYQDTDCEFRPTPTLYLKNNKLLFIEVFLSTVMHEQSYFISALKYTNNQVNITLELKKCYWNDRNGYKDILNRCNRNNHTSMTVGWMKINISFKEEENSVKEYTGQSYYIFEEQKEEDFVNLPLVVEPDINKVRFAFSKTIGFLNCLSSFKRWVISPGTHFGKSIPLLFVHGISQLEFKSVYSVSAAQLEINHTLYTVCFDKEKKLELRTVFSPENCLLPISQTSQNFYKLELNSYLFEENLSIVDDSTNVTMVNIRAHDGYGSIFIRTSSSRQLQGRFNTGLNVAILIALLLLLTIFITGGCVFFFYRRSRSINELDSNAIETSCDASHTGSKDIFTTSICSNNDEEEDIYSFEIYNAVYNDPPPTNY